MVLPDRRGRPNISQTTSRKKAIGAGGAVLKSDA